MEKALVLGKLTHRVPNDILENIKSVEGVTDASPIFGPYDFFAVVNAETNEMLSGKVLQIRSQEGVLDTMTCYAIEFSDIRPEPTGLHVE